MNPLTPEQVLFVRRQFVRWLRTREQFERDGWEGGARPKILDASDPYRIIYAPKDGLLRFKPGEFGQLCADIDHSALLWRLLEGGEPLPEAPPIQNAYPVYPPIPQPEGEAG